MKTLQSFTRKAGRVVLILILVLLTCMLMLAGVLIVSSPGKPKPLLNENGTEVAGSISEKIFVPVNGMEQGMFIRSKDKANPVLLFVHGGPGMPEYFLAEKYLTGIEDAFTVCYWEQRGAGISFNADPETLTAEQLIRDTLAVTNYLRERFGQERIYLMAHSGGSFIGIHAAARAPELYRAYIGVSQISRQFESEKLAYAYMLEQYAAAGNAKMVQKLKQYPIFESDAAMHDYRISLLRDHAMHELGIGTMHTMRSVLTGIFLPVMRCRAYTLAEKIHIWRGKANSQRRMRDQIDATDLTVELSKLEIPIYFLSGAYDYTVCRSLSADYLEKLWAPVKGFYTFTQSAHSPMFEEPEKFLRIMREDVLNGTVNLADAK